MKKNDNLRDFLLSPEVHKLVSDYIINNGTFMGNYYNLPIPYIPINKPGSKWVDGIQLYCDEISIHIDGDYIYRKYVSEYDMDWKALKILYIDYFKLNIHRCNCNNELLV